MQPAAAQDFGIQSITRSRDAVKYIMYVGNLMPTELRMSPEHSFGGLLRHDIRTLGHHNGYIRQCAITDCRQVMEAQWVGFVHPSERRHKATAYLLTENGSTRVVGKTSPDQETQFLYSPWYPEQDLGRVLAENVGIVDVPVLSAAEALEAQYFLFPDWDDITSGVKQLPGTLAELRGHFLSRRPLAVSNLHRNVIDAAIKSCDQFESAGLRRIAEDNATYDMAKVQGWAWSYGKDAELYMAQLGITRRDNLASQSVSNVDRLAEMLEKAFSRGLLNVAAPPVAATPEVEPVLPPPAPPSPSPVEMPAFEAKVGGAAMYQSKMGTITSIKGRTMTIETPDGEELKGPVADMIVIAEPESLS
jgi:hypothetical protein